MFLFFQITTECSNIFLCFSNIQTLFLRIIQKTNILQEKLVSNMLTPDMNIYCECPTLAFGFLGACGGTLMAGGYLMAIEHSHDDIQPTNDPIIDQTIVFIKTPQKQ